MALNRKIGPLLLISQELTLADYLAGRIREAIHAGWHKDCYEIGDRSAPYSVCDNTEGKIQTGMKHWRKFL